MTNTANLGLSKPAVGETGWGEAVDTNWDQIDTLIHQLLNPPADIPELVTITSNLLINRVSGENKKLYLDRNVVSSAVAGATDGQELSFTIKPNGFSFNWPPNFIDAIDISQANGNNTAQIVHQRWKFDGDSTQWYSVTPLQY